MKPRYNSKFMDLCFDISKANPRVAHARVGAALVYRNREIVCLKTNIRKSHPFQAKHSHHPQAIYVHAETNCVINALRSRQITIDDLKDCQMYVARACKVNDKTKDIYYRAIAKPCPGCMSTIVEYNIGAVYYTMNESDVEELRIT